MSSKARLLKESIGSRKIAEPDFSGIIENS